MDGGIKLCNFQFFMKSCKVVHSLYKCSIIKQVHKISRRIKMGLTKAIIDNINMSSVNYIEIF